MCCFTLCFMCFLDPEGGSQNAILVVPVVVFVVVVISSLKIPKAFLIRSAAVVQQSIENRQPKFTQNVDKISLTY